MAFDAQGVQQQPTPFSASDWATATNGPATVTYPAAGPGIAHVLTGYGWSYSGSGTLAGGNVIIQDNGVTVYSQDVTAAGAGFEAFPPKYGTPNTALTLILAGGSANITGTINGHGHKTLAYVALAGLDLSQTDNSALIAVL